MRRFNRAVFLLVSAAGLSMAAMIEAQSPIGQSGLSGIFVPPTQERSIMFSDRGRTYLVGTQTGRITFIDSGSPFVPQPVVPPMPPALAGLARQVYDSLMASPVDPSTRAQGAKALAGAIDATVGEVGGLGISEPQQIIDRLAANAEAANVNLLLKGWQLGTLLSGAKISTKDELLGAFGEIRKGLEAIR